MSLCLHICVPGNERHVCQELITTGPRSWSLRVPVFDEFMYIIWYMGMYPNQVHGHVPDSGPWVWSNGALDYNRNALKIRKAFSPIRPPKRGVEKNVEKYITASGRNNDCPFDEMCLLISLKFEPKFKKMRFLNFEKKRKLEDTHREGTRRINKSKQKKSQFE